ncbi:MAG: TlpA family protein disulfide reductase [Alloprevotella sp.]|nr:TlpA family protein disulfide reductase [Alloprevotella sp.]
MKHNLKNISLPSPVGEGLGVRLIWLLLALFTLTAQAQVKSKVITTLKGYPSGTIDEYHFHAGNAVVMGRFTNRTEHKFSTFNVTGTDLFSNQDFVRTIHIESDGSFLELISLPHSGWVYFDGVEIPPAFIAVGDTLEIQVDGSVNEAKLSGSGVTGEVNSVWPRLESQFSSKETRTPWEGLDRKFMLEWKNRKVKELDQIASAIDSDTITLLNGCSHHAKDVLKTSLLAMPLEQMLVAMHQWWWRTRSEDGKANPALTISAASFFDFLSVRQSYLMDNPLMVFAADGGGVINNMEFIVLNAYLFLANDMQRWSKTTDSDELGNYKQNFILPHNYDPALHREILAFDKGHLVSVADYYVMCSDSIRSRFGLSNTGFMMQLCLLHRVLDFDFEGSDDWFLTRKAEELAGAIPQFTAPSICHHAVDVYRRFVIEREGNARMDASNSTPGDSLFQSLKEKYAGNVIYMDFWGIGCGPCRRGMLDQRTLVEQYKDAPVRFLYICNEKDSPREPSEKFLTDNDIQGEHIFLSSDEWNLLTSKFQFNAIPFTLLIDRSGNIVEKNVPPTAAKLDELLK